MYTPMTETFAHIVAEHELELFDLFGPTLEFLVAPQPNDEAPCVMKGMIPPRASVPMHSHAGIETFFVISGEMEILADEGGKLHWLTARSGDFISVPNNAKHALKNRSAYPAVQLITSNSRL